MLLCHVAYVCYRSSSTQNTTGSWCHRLTEKSNEMRVKKTEVLTENGLMRRDTSSSSDEKLAEFENALSLRGTDLWERSLRKMSWHKLSTSRSKNQSIASSSQEDSSILNDHSLCARIRYETCCFTACQPGLGIEDLTLANHNHNLQRCSLHYSIRSLIPNLWVVSAGLSLRRSPRLPNRADTARPIQR